MTSREVVARAIRFASPDRLPYDLSPEYGSDFHRAHLTPSPDYRPPNGTDEWGAVWKNAGCSQLGEVVDFPLKDWAGFQVMSCGSLAELTLEQRYDPDDGWLKHVILHPSLMKLVETPLINGIISKEHMKKKRRAYR